MHECGWAFKKKKEFYLTLGKVIERERGGGGGCLKLESVHNGLISANPILSNKNVESIRKFL